MVNQRTLTEVLDVPENQRDSAWEIQFFHALAEGKLEICEEEPQNGPDGWPYLLTKSGDSSRESFQKVLHWLSDKGIGLVINPHKEFPDYVFSYGMLWFFKETGLFFREHRVLKEGAFEFEIRDIKSAGEPTENYLPGYVRKVLREFFIQQGVLTPRMLTFTLDGENYELAFSTESLGSPDPSEYQGILEALAWFLPPHYHVAVLSEKELKIPFVTL